MLDAMGEGLEHSTALGVEPAEVDRHGETGARSGEVLVELAPCLVEPLPRSLGPRLTHRRRFSGRRTEPHTGIPASDADRESGPIGVSWTTVGCVAGVDMFVSFRRPGMLPASRCRTPKRHSGCRRVGAGPKVSDGSGTARPGRRPAVNRRLPATSRASCNRWREAVFCKTWSKTTTAGRPRRTPTTARSKTSCPATWLPISTPDSPNCCARTVTSFLCCPQPDPGDGRAEDLAADTLLRAYRALQGYSAQRIRDLSVRPWLMTILRNSARNRARTPPADPLRRRCRRRVTSRILQLGPLSRQTVGDPARAG